MARITLRILLIVLLFTVGWSVGQAQTAVADFEVRIHAPAGLTGIACIRGCTWASGDGTGGFFKKCDDTPCDVVVNGRGIR